MLTCLRVSYQHSYHHQQRSVGSIVMAPSLPGRRREIMDFVREAIFPSR